MATRISKSSEDARGDRRHRWLPILGVFLLALIPRLIFQAEWFGSGAGNLPVIDALEYESEALRILAGQPTQEIYWHAPAVAYFIAGIYALAGWSPRYVGWAQAILGAATCLFVYLIGTRWFSRKWAFVAGSVCALYGPLIYFEAQLLRPSLFTFLLLFWLWVHLTLPQRLWGSLLSGLLIGLAALVRETALLLIPAIVLWEIVAGWRRGGPRRGLVLFFGAILMIAPVTVRNWQVGREFVPLSSSGGINFYIGNQPDSAQLQAIRPGGDWSELTARARREGGALHPGERSRFYYSQGFAYWFDEPLAALKRTCAKALAFCSAHEIPRNQSIYAGRAHSRLLTALVWRAGGFAFPFGILGPLAILGLAAALRRRGETARLAYLVLIYAAGSIAFFPAARYRIPLIPMAALLGVMGGQWLCARSSGGSRAVGWGLLLALLVLVGGTERWTIPPSTG